jgi:PilZ domain
MQGIMSPRTANSERRNNARKRPPSLIYVELSAVNGGMMRDLSEEGFALRAMMPLTPGENTTFSFLLGESTRIEGQGEIVWVEDKGRLAGIRFTEVSSPTRKEIQNWLNGVSEPQESDEPEEEPVASPLPDSQTFDQLREELRKAPPRPELPKGNAATPASAPPTPTNTEKTPPVVPPATPAQEVPAAASPVVTESKLFWPLEKERRPPDPIPFPGVPGLMPEQHAKESNLEPAVPAREPSANTPHPQQTPPITLPHFPEEDVIVRPRPTPDLPDISRILMQPPRKASYAAQPPVLEPLETPHHSREMYEENRKRGFTLGRAVTIMFVLACLATVVVYHQIIGQGLIWLGEQMGAVRVNENPTPMTTGQVPSVETNPPASKPANSPADSTAGSVPDKNTENVSDGAAQRNSGAQSALPSITQNPPPPVTPLAGISTPAASEPGQESGLVEYTKAQQLLHGKNGVSDPSEAVRLLWVSVEKGNPSAELTLAEMYWHGEGVARNCDQTRILLSAAARKGNSDAQKRLQQFQREGCE